MILEWFDQKSYEILRYFWDLLNRNNYIITKLHKIDNISIRKMIE